MRVSVRRLTVLYAALCSMAFLECGYPPDPSERDLLELERVWQYMRAYSLYSTRVPSLESALKYGDPATLLSILPDTLYIHGYDTTVHIAYYDPFCPDLGKRQALQSGAGGGTGLVRAGSVAFRMLTDSIAYVRIDSFTVTTDDSLRRFNSMADGVPRVIVDLLNNPGGNLDACTACVELFLPAGTPYLNVTYRKDPQALGDTGTVQSETWSARRTGDAWEGKTVAILVDNGTASAAEILTVALRDGLGAGNVSVHGRPTFGKAIGQYSFCLWRSSGAQIVLTGFRFYPVSGSAFDYHEKGIQPDDTILGSIPWHYVVSAGKRLDSDFENEAGAEVRACFETPVADGNGLRGYCFQPLPEAELPLF
jgi:hypothetical protein